MYNTSAAYREAIKKQVQQHRLHGQLIIGEDAFDFTQDNVLKKSFSLANQCSGSDMVTIGSVYTAELTVTLMGLDLQRCTLKDAQIVPYFDLLTRTGWESVPLGVFYVQEADWTVWGVELTAYDGMIKFDQPMGFDTTYGSIWDFVSMACEACGVALGMSTAQIRSLPNGNTEMGIYAENDLETWRDLIYWCAVTTGTIATFNRSGELEFRRYGITPVDELDADHRFKEARFSDFETRYTGVSLTDMKSGSTKRFSVNPDNGLTMDLGKNPFLQYGTTSDIREMAEAILSAVTVIDYVPVRVSMSGDPAYDLTDVIRFSMGAADGAKISCITSFDWTFGDSYEMEGVGKNPALEDARSKTDKELQAIRSQVNSQEMIFYEFTNSQPIEIGDGDTAIISNLRYSALVNTKVVFTLEALLDIETTVSGITYTDAVGLVTYELNESQITEYKPRETWFDGDHILHLRYVLDLNTTVMQHLVVKLAVSGGNVIIGVGAIKATLQGQGLAATDTWDGTFDISENLETVNIIAMPAHITATALGETFSITFQTPITITESDTLADAEIDAPPGIEATGMEDEASVEISEEET